MLADDIGRAVAAARDRAGVSIEQLAEQTSLEAVVLRAIEGGERLASTAKLDRIATALGLDASELYRGQEVERGLLVLPRYFADRKDFRQEDLPVFARAIERATALHDVTRLLGHTTAAGRLGPAAPGADAAQSGYDCARRVRVALENVAAPLGDLPTLLAREFAIPVLAVPLATGVLQAATVRSARTRAAAIVLNTAVDDGPTSGSLQAALVERVSLCHELCHAVFDEPRGGGLDVVLDEPLGSGHDRSPVEQRAGAFAAEALIPLFGLRQLFGDEGREVQTQGKANAMVDEVRRHFATPAEIAVNHLYDHGYIARVSSFREALINEARDHDVPTVSTGGYDAWRSVLLDRVRAAHEASLLSDGAARTLLQLPVAAALPWEA